MKEIVTDLYDGNQMTNLSVLFLPFLS